VSLRLTRWLAPIGDGDLRVRFSPGCDAEAGVRGSAQAIDVTGTQVKAYAEQKGLSSSNGAVRVVRAREALKKRVIESCGTCAEHGCVNCICNPRDRRPAYGFVELIRGTISTSPNERQFIISTCEQRLFDLMQRKFRNWIRARSFTSSLDSRTKFRLLSVDEIQR
jgi:hypothetical protein